MICSYCKREYVYKHRQSTKLLCTTCKTKPKRDKLKIRCVEYLGGKCCKCGYNRSMFALQFHHLDPSTKDFTISGNHSRTWEIIRKELDKCILVCANCHAELHFG